MTDRVVVVQKKGCSCCGTSCILMTAFVPLSVVGLWELIGVVSLAIWPVIFASAHVVRYATGHQKHYATGHS